MNWEGVFIILCLVPMLIFGAGIWVGLKVTQGYRLRSPFGRAERYAPAQSPAPQRQAAPRPQPTSKI